MGVKAEPSPAAGTAKQVDLAKEGVRRRGIGYAGERERVDEPILQRPEGAAPIAPAHRAFGRTPVFDGRRGE
jgi:hypothetical protein